jgi:hypothetical protein
MHTPLNFTLAIPSPPVLEHHTYRCRSYGARRAARQSLTRVRVSRLLFAMPTQRVTERRNAMCYQ